MLWLICDLDLKLSSLSVFFPDYLEVVTAVVVPRGDGKTSPRKIDIVLIFFHILVLQEYWVLAESK